MFDGGFYGSVVMWCMVNIVNIVFILIYNLYSDCFGGIVWDNIIGVVVIGNGNDQWYFIYGLVLVQIMLVVGIYCDIVNVIIIW